MQAPPAITLRQLQVFSETIVHGSLQAAAQALGMTPSAASMALAALESACDGPLFERTGRGLRLNDKGSRLLPRAREALGAVESLLAEARDPGRELAGTLRVGCSSTPGRYVFPSLAKDFTRRHPAAKLVLKVGNTGAVAAWVAAGAVDCGVVEGGVPHGLDQEPWIEDELLVVARKGHAMAGWERVPPEALSTETWIVRESGSGTLALQEHFMAANGIQARDFIEFGDMESVKRAVLEGLGIGILSRHAVKDELMNGRLQALAVGESITRRFSIATQPGQYRSRILEAFLAFTRGWKPKAIRT